MTRKAKFSSLAEATEDMQEPNKHQIRQKIKGLLRAFFILKPTPFSKGCLLPTPDSRLLTPDSRLPTPDSRLLTPDFSLISLHDHH